VSTPNPSNTSGAYQFSPGMGEAVAFAFGLCGVRRTALLQEHFEDARMATNLLMGEWSANGVNLWQVDLERIPLIQGCPTYPVPSNTIVMLDMYCTFNNGQQEIDRIMTPISRTEYASYPNKKQQGMPTTVWFNRLLSPTANLWPCPDGRQACFKYYRLRQTQDSNLANGQNVEIPVYFQNAYAFGLAEVLSYSWAPDKTPMLKMKAAETFGIASRQNVEQANIYISPMISGYFR
jgi:hypothetical protein